MNKTKDVPQLFSRRQFILSALIGSVLVNNYLPDVPKTILSAPNINPENDFVILNGWVMLNNDLGKDTN